MGRPLPTQNLSPAQARSCPQSNVHWCCRFEQTYWAQPAGPLQKPVLDYRLYAVTDPGCNARCGRSNVQAVQLAVQGGATLIQLREKSADGGLFVQEALALMDLLQPTGVR